MPAKYSVVDIPSARSGGNEAKAAPCDQFKPSGRSDRRAMVMSSRMRQFNSEIADLAVGVADDGDDPAGVYHEFASVIAMLYLLPLIFSATRGSLGPSWPLTTRPMREQQEESLRMPCSLSPLLRQTQLPRSPERSGFYL